MDREKGSIRAVLDSLYSVFTTTRAILREGGPDLAARQNSFGPLAIRPRDLPFVSPRLLCVTPEDEAGAAA
jgi:hypothetical protein